MKKFSLIFVLLAGVFWGSSPVFVSIIGELGFNSIECTAIRLLLAAPMLFVLLLIFDKKLPKISLKMLLCFASSGICSVLAMCLSYYYAIKNTSAAVAAVLLYTAPIFVMIMSVIFFKEKITAKKSLCLILAVLGCALTSGIIGGIKGTALGVFFGIMSGFTYSLYGIISTVALREGATPLSCTAFSFLFASIGGLIISNPINIAVKTASLDAPFLAFLMMLLFSLCTAVIPYALYTLGLSGLKPDIAAIAASSEPVVASLFGIFWLKQSTDAFQIIGIALVVITITVLNVNPKVKQSK